MKKFSVLTALFSIMFLFAACSSDDKKDDIIPPGKVDFAGFYKGDLLVSLEGTTLDPIPGKVQIIDKGEGKAKLQLRNFKFGDFVIGDIIVDDVVVTTKGEAVYLNGEENMTLIVGECDVVVEASIINKKMEAAIDVVAKNSADEENPEGQTLNIKVIFNGELTDDKASSEAKILTFSLKDIETKSTIEGEKITLTVENADGDKIVEAMPEITISENATVSPAIDVAQDFTKAVEYTVTAEDGITTIKYTVNVIVGKNKEAAITKFGLKGLNTSEAVIADDKISLSVDFADADKLKEVFPEIEISNGATISPAVDVAQDFTQPVEYTVTAEDGETTAKFIVTVAVGKNTEAVITKFSLKDVTLLKNVIEGKTINLSVDYADRDKLKNAFPEVEMSAGATISPSLEIAQDFTLPVEYIVTAENGVISTSYKVILTLENMPEPVIVPFDFSTAVFDTYKHNKSKNQSALPITIDPFKWDSSDGGVEQLFGFFVQRGEKFGVTYSDNDIDFSGPAFSIESLDTKGKGPIGSFPATPKITSGSLFLGNFKLDMKVPLKSTKFGVIIKDKPLAISGKLSYKSGLEYHYCPDPSPQMTNITEVVPGKKDEGLVGVVVYEVADAEESLNGLDIYTSDKIIGMAKATYQDGFKGDFKLDIEYTKDFDPAKTYKLAVIFSASKDGDKFSGAGGSTLKLAKLDLVFEK